MTDTTKPPNRPTTPRPRPFGRDDNRRDESRRDGKPERGGDKPRGRSWSDRPDRDAPSRRDPGATTRGAEPAPPKDDARIAKVMARAGLCSRRDAEGWIAAGRVAVNGAVIESPALNVNPGDRITVDGEPLPEREQTRLYMFHKPRGLVTTARDPEGRPTIFDNLPEGLPRVVSVGRLDINTEGLMLLTNDGGLARVLELPATGWLRRYRVRANGSVDQAQLDALKAGVTIDGVDYAGIEATLDRMQGANVWLTMGLREGKNREIKRVLESLGLAVTRLIRISFGPFQLGELAEGSVESVPTRVLRDQLGPGLAAQAGVDLQSRDDAPSRRDPETAPARPSRSAPAAARPHVGAMRAAREEAAGEGRKRIERGATADRKGRAVKVERVIPAGAGSERGGDSRNARRFAAEKQDYVGGRQKTRAEAGGGNRTFGDARSARAATFDGARAPRAGGFDGDARGNRSGGFAARPRTPRIGDTDGDARGNRSGGFAARPRPPRTGDSDGDARGNRSGGFVARPRTPRTGDSDGDARGNRSGGFAARPRPPRTGDSDGDARGNRSGGFAARPRPPRAGDGDGDGDARGNRSGGFAARPRTPWSGGADGEPRGERAGGFGAKPRTGKPNGRPGGFSSERPATGRNKPAGGRPGGDRPSGGRPFGGDRPKDGGKGGGKGGGRPPRGRP